MIYSERNNDTGPDALAYKKMGYIGNMIGSPLPVLDQDVNLVSWIQAERYAELVRSAIPSGWLLNIEAISASESQGAIRADPDNLGANALQIGLANAPMVINVNGYLIEVADSTDNPILVGLNVPPDGATEARVDLVFLEAWIMEVTDPGDSPAVADYRESGLLDDGTIPVYGNTQYTGAGQTNDSIDENISQEVNRRIQVQYRIRVFGGASAPDTTGITMPTSPDYMEYLEGIDDPQIFAWPIEKRTADDAIAESDYNYSKSATDPGLYRAGDGSTLAKNNLGSVDGYIYAIPIAMVHRRNSATYSVSNPNGSVGNVISSVASSDRPDNLDYNGIVARDVIDLRHEVAFKGFDHKLTHDNSVDLLFRRQLRTDFAQGNGFGTIETVFGTLHTCIEQFGNFGAVVDGIDKRTAGGNNPDVNSLTTDGQRATWNEAAVSPFCHNKLASGGTTIPDGATYGARRSDVLGGDWQNDSVVQVTCPAFATLSDFAIYQGDASNTVVAFDAVQTVPPTEDYDFELTLKSMGGPWSGDLHVIYKVNYPVGCGLRNLPENFLSAKDVSDKLVFFEDDLANKQDYQLASGEYGFYWSSNQYGPIFTATGIIDSSNELDITLPNDDYAVVGIAKVRNTSVPSDVEDKVASWTNVGTNMHFFFSSGVSVDDVIEVELYLTAGCINVDEPTRSVTGTFEVVEVSVVISGGTGSAFVDNGEVALYVPKMYGGLFNIKKSDDDMITATNITIDSSHNHRITVTGASEDATVIVPITVRRPYSPSEYLRMWYEHVPPMALRRETIYYDDAKVKYLSDNLVLTSLGTGALHTTDNGGSAPYESLASQLPINSNSDIQLYELVAESLLAGDFITGAVTGRIPTLALVPINGFGNAIYGGASIGLFQRDAMKNFFGAIVRKDPPDKEVNVDNDPSLRICSIDLDSTYARLIIFTGIGLYDKFSNRDLAGSLILGVATTCEANIGTRILDTKDKSSAGYYYPLGRPLSY